MARKRNIIELAMKYRQIVFLIALFFVVIGIFGLIEIRKNEFPSFVVRQGIVVAVYPGANVDEVENRVTKPLENYVFTYGEVKKKETFSSSRDGISIIKVELEDDVHDNSGFWSKFKHGINNFKSQLPAGVVTIIVMDDFGDASSLLLTIESKNKTYSELDGYLDGLADRLRPISSIGRINRYGVQKEQISIYLDDERLSHYGLGWKSTMLFLSGQGLINISGTIKDSLSNRPIYIQSDVNVLEDVQNLIIFSAPDGSIVRLSDVAKVVREYPEPSSYITQNQNKCVVMSVEMKSGNNIVKMGEDIQKAISDYEKSLPEEVKLTRITDQCLVVSSSVINFLQELLIAIIAVIFVVMFLQPINVAFVAAITIPITIFISLGLFYLFGFELNTVTLAALIVTLGMIVDNSIVILDDYQEKISEGENRWKAASQSATHFFKSIFSATLAISITFFPFLFTMRGMFGDFLQQFPWSLAIILGISLLIAVLIVPFLQFALIKPKEKKKKAFSFESILEKNYKKLLDVCFKHPVITVLLGIIAVIIGAIGILQTPIKLLPIAQRDQFSVEIYAPTGYSLKQTVAIADSLETILSKDERVTNVTSFKGCSSPRYHITYAPQFAGPHFAQFIVNTKSSEATDKMIQEYSERYSNYFPDAYVRFKQLSYSKAASPIEIRISGDSIDALMRSANKVSTYLKTIPDVFLVRNSFNEPLAGIQVNLKEAASKMGISQTMAETFIATRYSSGLPIASLWEGDRNINVVLKGTHADSANAANLGNEKMPTYGGLGNIPLREIADITPIFHKGEISHKNGVRLVTVSAEVSPDKSANEIAQTHIEFIRNMLANEDVQVSLGGETEIVEEEMPRIMSGLIFSILIIFFIMLWHFKKIKTSLALLISLSLCSFGTAVSLKIMNLDFSITCVLGIVSLLGIMVRNGIIMIDYAEEIKKTSNYTTKETIYYSALRRMRPIFLTSAAASVGVIPMILGGSSLWMPMGSVVFFGTLITMIFILTVFPVVYWGVNGGINWKRRSK